MKNLYKTWPEVQKKSIRLLSGSRVQVGILLVLMSLLITARGWAQPTTVFTDNFDRGAVVSPLSNGGTPTMTWTTSSTITPAGTSTTNLNSGTNYNVLLQNNVTTPVAGRTYITGPLSTYSTPFVSTLGSNPGPITWTFNMKTNRSTALSGFDAANYGSAVVLAATSSDFMTANGYAVVMVKGTTFNALKLVRFASGIAANANLSTIIGPSADLASNTRWASIKVTYTPSTNLWQLFVRDDGSTTDPTDPTTGTLTQVGTNISNTTYTSTVMTHCGFFYDHGGTSAAASNRGMYDNFSVVVTPVLTPSLTAVPSTLSGFSYILGSGPSSSQYYNLSGVNLDGTTITVTGSTDYEVATDLNPTFAGSVNIPYTAPTLAATKIYVRLKGSLAAGNYNSENIGNAGGGASNTNTTCSGTVLPGPTLYTWQGANLGDWTVGTNWNPTRTTAYTNDILQFNDNTTKTITNVPTQTIGKMIVSNNTTIELQSAAPVTLTIAGGTGVDFDLQGGSALNIAQATNAIIIALNTGATGSVSGAMTFSTAAHKITSADASGLTFQNGSAFTAGTLFSSNAFGAGTANSVIFANGSKYISYAGANPFALTAPASVVIFQTGSTYVLRTTGAPSLANRVYANFEFDEPTGTSLSASSPVGFDNLTVTQGSWSLGVKAVFTIAKDISVAPGATLNLNPTTAGTILLSGLTGQSIGGGGTIIFGGFQNVTAANNLTFGTGTITFASGSSLITNGTVTGSARFERIMSNTAPGRWHYIASPITNGLSGIFTSNWLVTYSSEYANGWLDFNYIIDPNVLLNPGQGYAAYVSSSNPSSVIFNGHPNTSLPVYNCITQSIPTAGTGYNFVGNGYPCAVDMANGNNTWPSASHTCYFWDPDNQTYKVYTTVSPSHTQYAPAEQGFFIETAVAGSFQISPAARIHNSEAFLKDGGVYPDVLKLDATNPSNGYVDGLTIGFVQGTTAGYDVNYDAAKLPGGTEAPQVFSILPDNQKVSYNIQEMQQSNSVVKAGFTCGVNGNFTLNASNLESFSNFMKITLEDLKTGNIQDLRTNPEYSFTYSTTDDPSRFLLHFSNTTGISDKNAAGVQVYSFGNSFYIRNLDNQLLKSVFVYDLLGKQVFQSSLNKSILQKFATGVNPGYYMIKVVSETGVTTRKVFID